MLYAALLLVSGGFELTGGACLIAVLAAWWVVYRMTHFRSLAGTLSLRDSGLWEVALSGTKKTMRLTHAWPAFAWITLQFDDVDSSHSSAPLELVVWRASMSRSQWCALCVHVAGQIVIPGRILQKGTA
ncbi:hypothetical protein EKL30_12400 [Candidimonas sp. SYP-B2681]|uniref:hypothetical protein n=1 Tax=Candidimonas sp. SYP-B2681 TaxID=2497686 RepID=UPI000F89B6E9|nr:hypothetical protein [Candidimonas sp. SYP-B2681]RTZ42497.1 hypothetical protein EKL30_12400 [Candidimonas sp. SYP-B2681]